MTACPLESQITGMAVSSGPMHRSHNTGFLLCNREFSFHLNKSIAINESLDDASDMKPRDEDAGGNSQY